MLRDETTSRIGSFHDQFRYTPEPESLGVSFAAWSCQLTRGPHVAGQFLRVSTSVSFAAPCSWYLSSFSVQTFHQEPEGVLV